MNQDAEELWKVVLIDRGMTNAPVPFDDDILSLDGGMDPYSTFTMKILILIKGNSHTL